MKMTWFICWRNILIKSNIRISRKCCSTVAYPPIYDESRAGKKLRAKQEWRDAISRLSTVEEKLLYMCTEHKEHKQEHKKVIGFALKGVSCNYNSLPLRQHCTRTHLIPELPPHYRQVNVDAAYERLKGRLADAVLFAHAQHVHRPPDAHSLTPVENDRRLAGNVVDALLRVLVPRLSQDYPHLRSAEIDINPRSEAFWSCGKFDILEQDKKRKSKETLRNNFFFYEGKPLCQIRTADPLPPFLPLDDELCLQSEIPLFPYDPRTIGTTKDEKHLTLIPGCWPNKRSGFGHLSFHSLEELHHRRDNIGVVDEAECLSEYGLIASFGWLLAIATYQGFSPWNEITYPFSTQTVITDGQMWNFFAYQLNANCLYNESDDSLRNLCWESGGLKLFDVIENEEMKGLNDEVFKLLIKMLINVPAASNEQLRPYLKDDLENKEWANVDDQLRLHYSQIPLKRIREEYQWEKFYIKTNSYLRVNPNRKR